MENTIFTLHKSASELINQIQVKEQKAIQLKSYIDNSCEKFADSMESWKAELRSVNKNLSILYSGYLSILKTIEAQIIESNNHNLKNS